MLLILLLAFVIIVREDAVVAVVDHTHTLVAKLDYC